MVLLSIARTLFPHLGVDDQPYLRAVAYVELRCRCDFIVFHDVKTGLDRLHWLSASEFTAMAESAQVAVLRRLQHTSFFRVVYRELLEGLYGSPDSWRLLT